MVAGMADFWKTLARPWQVCLEEAWDAYVAGSLPIGACVTDPHGTVLSRGRNRLFEAFGPAGLIFGHDLAHAEMNALLALPSGLRGGVVAPERHALVVYTSTEPCPLCLGAFYMSGIRNLRFAARDPFAGSVNLLGTTPYLRRKHVVVTGPESADLESIIVALHVAVSLGLEGHTRAGSVLDTWRPIVRRGVVLGESLAASGLLERLKAENANAAQTTNELATVLAALSEQSA